MNEKFTAGFEKSAGAKELYNKIRKALTGKIFPKSNKYKDATKQWDALRKAEQKVK